jgi:hypothetical protein
MVVSDVGMDCPAFFKIAKVWMVAARADEDDTTSLLCVQLDIEVC